MKTRKKRNDDKPHNFSSQWQSCILQTSYWFVLVGSTCILFLFWRRGWKGKNLNDEQGNKSHMLFRLALLTSAKKFQSGSECFPSTLTFSPTYCSCSPRTSLPAKRTGHVSQISCRCFIIILLFSSCFLGFPFTLSTWKTLLTFLSSPSAVEVSRRVQLFFGNNS